ncbi:MAG: TonB-dependent receptor, partial [Rhodospirillaceae bacterium]|nr:TonB-dependent receptor [Rhodospirillaceae bacterium]
INIITKRPGTEMEGYVRAEYDFDLNGAKVETAATLPLSENFSVRVAGKYSDYDGWVYNTLASRDEPQREETVGRITARYVTDMVDATLKYEHTDLNVKGNVFQIVSAIANRPLNLVKETGSPFFGPEFDDVETDNVAANVDIKLGDFTLSSITGYSNYNSDQREDADFIEKDLAYAVFQEDFEQTSQELRLLSPTDGDFDFVLGGYWHNSKLHERRATGIVATPAASSFRPFDQKSTVHSVYGQFTATLSEQFDVLGSLRYTEEQKVGDFALYSGPLAVSQQVGTLARTIHNEFKENHTDPSISLQYKPTDDVMLYGSYSHGSKAGGFQGAISNALANSFKFDPETSESFELGAKASFDGRATLNVAAFETTYKNLQLSVAINTTSTTSFAFYTGNAGAAKARGIEADGQVRLSDEFKLEGSFAWTPTAKYTSYPAGPCATGQAPTNAAALSCNLTGVRLGFIPKIAGTTTLHYTAPFTAGTKLDIGTTAAFRSSARMDPANDPMSYQSGFVKLDARIAVVDEKDVWEVALLGRNLTDIRNFTFSGAASLAANPAVGLATDARQRAVDPPRTIAIQAQVKF